jgi:hypothetical protein
MPDIAKFIIELSLKMKKERVTVLEDNEKYINKKGNGDFETDSDEEDDGETMEDDNDEY